MVYFIILNAILRLLLLRESRKHLNARSGKKRRIDKSVFKVSWEIYQRLAHQEHRTSLEILATLW